MRIGDLRPPLGANTKRKRVGRGRGSTHGKTCGKGTNGQKVRQGESIPAGFEGGQTPLHRRLPKRRGISKGSMPIGMFRKRYAVINVGQLEALGTEERISPELLRERGIFRRREAGVRVLGEGELTKPLIVAAHHFSATARAKIEAAGGTVEVI